MSLLKLVDEGIRLRAEIFKLEKILEAVELGIIEEAKKGEQIDLVDQDREGRQFLAQGTSQTVPVIFTADKLVQSFMAGSDVNKKICASLPESFSMRPFYAQESTWKMIPKNGKLFRALAGHLLGADAPKFVTACLSRDKDGIPKSDIKIEWDRAEEIA